MVVCDTTYTAFISAYVSFGVAPFELTARRVFIFCACANVESISRTINELSYAFNFNFQLVDFHAPVSARKIIPCARAWRLTAVQCKVQYRSESLYNPFLREQALVKGIRTLGSRLDEGARQSLKMRNIDVYIEIDWKWEISMNIFQGARVLVVITIRSIWPTEDRWTRNGNPTAMQCHVKSLPLDCKSWKWNEQIWVSAL